MKRVGVPSEEPAVLSEFRRDHPDGTWDQFKDVRGNEAVFDALAAAQGHLCAYCEIGISRPLEGEVEHFEPKSSSVPGTNLHLKMSNLLAACEGGVREWQKGRSERPIAETCHCGALKGDRSPVGALLDPRALPFSPALWSVASSGALGVDEGACVRAGVDPQLAKKTLETLGLNRKVLLRLRSERLAGLDDEALADATTDEDVAARILAIAERELLPADGKLPEFWTTVRAWAGPAIEPFLAARADQIPGA
jgi:uncharacterized protein (TIGR02646 family)